MNKFFLWTDFHLGVLAGDEATYEVYKELFDPIIQDYHNGFKPTGKSPTASLLDMFSLMWMFKVLLVIA